MESWYSYDDLRVEPFPIEWQDRLEYIRKSNYVRDMLYRGYSIDEINEEPKKVEPFIVVFKSKPIQGIVLELWGKNPEYNWEV